MKVFIQTLVCSLIFVQMYAQQIPVASGVLEKENTNWITFKTAEQIPAQQLAQSKTTLQLEADDELQLLKTEEDQLGFRHHRYQQLYKGIPVEGAIYLMHEKNNQVKQTNGKLVHKLSLNTSAGLSETAALQSALQHINATEYAWENIEHENMLKEVENRADATFYPTGELVIFNPDTKQKTEAYRLAYKFDIYAVEPSTRKIVYVDAQTGAILGSVEKIHDCSGQSLITANTNYSGSVNFDACSDGTLESSVGGGLKVFTSNNNTSYPQILASNTDPTAAEVFWATEKTYQYFLNEHGRNSLNDNGMPLLSWVHYGNSVNNAFWNGSWMTYGDGDNVNFSWLTSPDVVAHEMTHGVTEFSAGLIYSFQSGALSESFSDLFGEVAENYMLGTNDWLIGGDFTVLPGKNSLRNMSNPNDLNAMTQQPDTYNGNYWYNGFGDNGGVHYNSGVQNYWFYLLSEGGNGTNDNGDAYYVSSIGMDKAAAIAYRNLTVYLTPNSQYADARTGSIQAAVDLYGAGSNEALQTEAAWCAVGLGTCTMTITCRYNDSLALVALYNSTNGANWTNTWDLNQSMDTWDGVSLNVDGCVTCLDLDGVANCANNCCDGNNLVGTIPAELGNLSELTYLSLRDNQLTGSIPPELGNLNSLQTLSLTTNQLTGSIPPELGNLSNLWHLILSKNQLTGSIPSELGNMSSLTQMLLYENQLTGSIPSELGNLSNLDWLMLKENQLTGSIPTVLGNLNLSRLFIDDNQLSGCYDTNLSNLCNTISTAYNWNQHISDGNNFDVPWEDFCNNGTGICQDTIVCSYIDSLALVDFYTTTNGADWTNAWDLNQPMDTWFGVSVNADGCVTCLDLDGVANCSYDCCAGNNIIGYIPASLGNLSQLTFLGLRDNSLAGNIPPELGNLSLLQSLSLESNNLVGSIPPELGNLNALIDMRLERNNLSGSIPAELGNLSNLTTLRLYQNNLSGNIPPELGNLSTLQSLSLSLNNLTGSIPAELGNLSNLISISLFDNQLTGSIPTELGNLLNLNYFTIHSNQLSGCYDTNLSNLCNTLFFDTNQNISDGNNFYAPWEDFCNSGAGICQDSTACSYVDSLALVDLYNTTNGANWTNTWDLNQPMDTWFGVSLNTDGCVSILNLSNNQLVGTISPELGNLNNLLQLRLLNNQLSGSIPSELENLSNLTELRLDNNQLSGSIPTELENLSNLTELRLNNNQLTGSIPTELGNLSSLQVMSLGVNQLTGSLPAILGDLNLVFLTVNDNQLSGCYDANLSSLCSSLLFPNNSNISDGNNFDIPWESFCNIGASCDVNTSCAYMDSLALVALYDATDGANWTNTWDLNQPMNTWYGLLFNADGCVSDIDLNANQLVGTIPAEIGNLMDLERLYLGANNLSGQIPVTIGNLFNLQRLFLNNNQLSGSIPAELGNLSNLTDLSFINNQLTGSIPSELGNMSSLQMMTLENNQLSGSIPATLGNLSNLTQLTLKDNQLSGSIPAQLGNMTNLNQLILSDNQLTGSIPAELGNMGSLLVLSLSNNQLSGCYDANLSNLCSTTFTSFNSYISDGNNLNATWEDFCNIGAGTCTPNISCTYTDSLALVAFYNATDGANWTNPWELAAPMNTWYGLLFNTDGCVSTISLDNNQLDGTIPPEIGNLTSLERLYLGRNNLSGEIPSTVSNLVNLEWFHANENQLGGELPVGFYDILSLRSINLSDNLFDGIIRPELENMTDLFELKLMNNQFTGDIPSTLGNLNILTTLHLSNNQLSGCYDDNLVSVCTQLNPNSNTNFYISDGNSFDASWEDFCSSGTGSCQTNIGFTCAYTDSLALVDLYNATNGPNWATPWDLSEPVNTWYGLLFNVNGCVSAINLESNQLQGSIPLEIGNLKHLEQLHLGSNSLSGELPNTIGSLINLEGFDISDNLLTGGFPTGFYEITSLKSINVDKNQLGGTIRPELANMSNLVQLNLSNNQFVDNIPSSLGKLSNLTDLYLRNNQLSGCYDAELAPLCAQLNTSYSDISDGNNFDAPWEAFCSSGSGSCSGQVWPGDFNNDGIAEITDFLYWSLAEGETGSTRPGASLSWIGQDSPDWQGDVNGINGKHQDGNGNGIIDSDDVLALLQNYNRTHVVTSTLTANSPLDLRLELISSVSGDNATVNTFGLYIESSEGLPVSTHGVACSISFDQLPNVLSVTVDTTGSSLNPDTYLEVYDSTLLQLDLAISRTDNNNQLISGPILTLIVVNDDLQAFGTYTFKIDNGSMMSAAGVASNDGILTGVNGSTFYGTFDDGGLTSDLSATVSATDEQCNTLGQATVQPIGGTGPYTYLWSNGATTAQVSNLVSGQYTVNITDGSGLSTSIPIQINGAIQVYDDAGNPLCNNTCPEFLTPTGGLSDGQYRADNVLDSDAIILPGNSVDFKAGQTIELGNGFSIPAGAEFSGEIEDCDGN